MLKTKFVRTGEQWHNGIKGGGVSKDKYSLYAIAKRKILEVSR